MLHFDSIGSIIGITAVVAMFSSIYGIKAIMKENKRIWVLTTLYT